MKALSKLKPEPGIWMIDDAEVPAVKDNEVLIRIKKTAICGTDIHIYNWDEWSQKTVPVPMITGHEYAGIVEKVGADVTRVKPGDRVSGEGHIVCGTCRNCRAGTRHLCPHTIGVGVNRQGAFAEFLAIPEENVVKLPDEISDEIASILDPLGNATHTALSFNVVGEDVLITGAGPIGIMAAAICKHVGARHVVITDVNPDRLALARQMGINNAIDISKKNLKDVMQELGMKEGFDVGLEMSGNENGFRELIHSMNSGGRVAILGIPPKEVSTDWCEIVLKGLTIKGIYGREMYETWYKMIALLQSGLDMTPMITHRFKIDDFQKGFDAMRSGQSGKVILEWD
ncbi:MAG: L-threonine 3-dehydrogenase [Rhodospirillales bacterium]|nr:L-threonine 3-dehydrogenase [Rhodospirillales bacterium]MCB9995548.1 L-threonine 3-dehydrogenase [Rhodospirillales bacterium]